jgi:hypothetical protein
MNSPNTILSNRLDASRGNIKNTLAYIQMINFENDEFHSAVAKIVDEAGKLWEEDFYVC